MEVISDGSKSKKKSGGVWIISDSKGITIIEGTNPDFECITAIHSHRAKKYEVLSVLTFLKAYCDYFMIQWNSYTTYYCDNSGVVSKLQTLSINPNFYDENTKRVTMMQC